MADRARILLVCVNYHGDESTSRYLESWAARPGSELLDAIVVDNSERIDGFVAPPSLGLEIESMKPGRNLGYLGGALYGLRAYVKRAGLPEWCIVSNVDLRIGTHDFVDRLLQMPVDPMTGMIAPSIISGLTGVDQNPFLLRRPLAARMRAYKYLYSSYGATLVYEQLSRLYKRIKGALRASTEPSSSARPVYAPHGSFLIFARRFFELGGTLEYPCFLFGEEIHLAEQARRLGLKVVYNPELRVMHAEHESVGHYLNPRMLSYARAAAVFCANEYF